MRVNFLISILIQMRFSLFFLTNKIMFHVNNTNYISQLKTSLSERKLEMLYFILFIFFFSFREKKTKLDKK